MTIRFGKNKVKYNLFEQTEQKIFQDLKQIFITASILAYYNFKLETWTKTKFSNFVIISILLQMFNKILWLVAYFSKKLTLVKYNYMIYIREFLAIVKSFEMWHLELGSTIG